jgi:predicted Zn finger-like uncharacterized protein
MLISCPSCRATYNVPEHLLAADGQMLRCAQCAHEWLVMPPPAVAPAAAEPVMPAPALSGPIVSEHVPEPPDPVGIAPAAAAADGFADGFDVPPSTAPLGAPDLSGRGLQRPAKPPVQPVALAMAWVLTVFVMISIGWGAVRWRGEVMQVWPPSERAYAVLGLN